jgi:hypothetical protein
MELEWFIDGIPFKGARRAAAHLGVGKDFLLKKSKIYGTRNLTTDMLELDKYRRHKGYLKDSGNKEWESLSGSENTGRGRGEIEDGITYFRNSMAVHSVVKI